MLRNNLKIALRNLFKNRLFSFINIGGLAIGMAVAIVIGLWIWDEVTFNQYHNNYDSIAQVMQRSDYNGEISVNNSQSKGLASAIRMDYGDQFDQVVMSSWEDERTLSFEERKVMRSGMFMEKGAAEMLSLKMLYGSDDRLDDPNTILLSETTATILFGNKNPINESIQLGNEVLAKVGGVYEDLPENSYFATLEFLAAWKIYEKELPDWIGWGNNWFQVFVQLADQTQLAQASKTIEDVYIKNLGKRAEEYKPYLFLHPMSKWHLYSEFENGVNAGGLIKYVWLFGSIGLIVLLLACINFMNLSTARSEKRAKEVGIRKAIGSSRRQLIGQFFSESVVIAFFAFALSILLVVIMLPFFNEVADKEMKILWSNPLFWCSSIGFTLFTGLLAGTYPALYLSSFKAVRALKGRIRVGPLAVAPRKVLVVLQFTVSVALIVCTIIVSNQIQYAKNRAIGYDQNRLIDVPIRSDQINQHFDAIRNELIQANVVEEMALSQSSITQVWNGNGGISWEGKPAGFKDYFLSMNISHEFGKTVGWNIVQGRDFSKELATDETAFIINQAAVDYMGLDDPIGKVMDWGNNGKHEIIGVVEDIVTGSPFLSNTQMFFMLSPEYTYNTVIKISPSSNTKEALATIEKVYQKYDPLNPFEYEFVDQSYAEKFGEEERIGKLAGFFALLAIFISCLGLFAMISFMAEQRTKEIGIRKVLGASITSIVALLSKDFIKLVLIAFLIATPIAYYFMSQWLQDFAYRIELHWWMFALAGFAAISIALLTVSFQSIRAALANPVNSLRNE